ncbi:DUF975 family protein [Phosphitispora sp. TUW77]|uniref:DUF975 family protein n=1 Tax=Phosphitispora sp. TUW77 TaxID=3152361 RepID=UPI003AB6F616
MWSRIELKTKAKAVLKTSYWKAFLVSLIIGFVGGNSGGFSFNWHSGNEQNHINLGDELLPYLFIFMTGFLFVVLIILAFRVLLGYALEVGGRRYFVQSAQENVDLNFLGIAFEKEKYFNIIKTMLWRAFLNFLWYLLLLIPGIVKSYAYRMVPYILADNPNIGYSRAIELSNKMTDGQKFKMFILDLSFIGWYILGFIAFFIGILFVLPYVNATQAELYLALRQNAIDRGDCSYEELQL